MCVYAYVYIYITLRRNALPETSSHDPYTLIPSLLIATHNCSRYVNTAMNKEHKNSHPCGKYFSDKGDGL
jgi:hypothetical protein